MILNVPSHFGNVFMEKTYYHCCPSIYNSFIDIICIIFVYILGHVYDNKLYILDDKNPEVFDPIGNSNLINYVFTFCLKYFFILNM